VQPAGIPLSRPSPLRSRCCHGRPLTYTPSGRAWGGGRARSFQFARVVHSTGDRKILGEENSFSSASLLPSSPLPGVYYPIFPSGRTGAASCRAISTHSVKLYIYIYVCLVCETREDYCSHSLGAESETILASSISAILSVFLAQSSSN